MSTVKLAPYRAQMVGFDMFFLYTSRKVKLFKNAVCVVYLWDHNSWLSFSKEVPLRLSLLSLLKEYPHLYVPSNGFYIFMSFNTFAFWVKIKSSSMFPSPAVILNKWPFYCKNMYRFKCRAMLVCFFFGLLVSGEVDLVDVASSCFRVITFGCCNLNTLRRNGFSTSFSKTAKTLL